MAVWLLDVSRCAVPVADKISSPAEVAGDWLGHLADAGWLTFTEPNLSFAVGRYLDQQVHLLVGLGYESAPRLVLSGTPPLASGHPCGRCTQVQAAGAALRTELAAYPGR